VLDGDPAPPIFGPWLLWRNGWMDQDTTWYGGVRRGPTDPHQFSAHVRCGQTAGWIKMPLCVGDPAPQKGAQRPHHFWSMSIVAKRLDGSRCHLVGRCLCPDDTVLDENPDPHRKGTAATDTFHPSLLGHGHPSQQLLNSC